MNYVKCKACGYVMKKKDLKSACPACGMPKQVFEKHKIIAEERKNWLKLHAHPIIVHFPVSFSIILFIASLLLIISPNFQTNTITIIQTTSILIIPIVTILSILIGLKDANERFKKFDTKYLKIKILTGIILLITSTIPLLTLLNSQTKLIISTIILTCTLILGKIGGELTCLFRA